MTSSLAAEGAAPSWSIRPAGPSDARMIAAFHTAAWEDAYRGIVPDGYLAGAGIDQRTARWRRRLADRRRQTALAVLGARVSQEVDTPGAPVIAAASWRPSHDPPEPELPPLELATFYVGRPWWGSGLAGELLAHAIGDRPAHLWVFEANGRARAFYEKHGFRADGHTKTDEGTGVAECRYIRI